jgi:Homeodomain-like domain
MEAAMTQKRYIVKLTGEERTGLEGMLTRGKHLAATLTKVRILLMADVTGPEGGGTDAEICETLSLQKNRPEEVRRLFAEEGLERVLMRKKRKVPPIAPIFDGEKGARLTMLACSKPPKGHARWTLRLLADKVVELGIVERASHSTVGLALKKINSSLT